jgi:hypothetical protein
MLKYTNEGNHGYSCVGGGTLNTDAGSSVIVIAESGGVWEGNGGFPGDRNACWLPIGYEARGVHSSWDVGM